MQVRLTYIDHGRCLLDGCSAQTVSSDYQDKIVTKEDIHSELANLLPLETLRREALRGAAKLWALYGAFVPSGHIF